MGSLTLIIQVGFFNYSYNLGVDLSQQIVDIDFQNFCLMYTVEGVINLLN